ncbi:MAG: hypothetical protein HW390_3408, partial [Candidatus Brocadiaceae bacterium]|nr:hypothetical protein [Candidatus Brocadiaceae bacterium]
LIAHLRAHVFEFIVYLRVKRFELVADEIFQALLPIYMRLFNNVCKDFRLLVSKANRFKLP